MDHVPTSPFRSEESGHSYLCIFGFGLLFLLGALLTAAAGMDRTSSTIGLELWLSFGGAALIWATTMFGRYRKAGAWLGLAILGHGAALQMVDAGNRIHYQHLRSPAEVLQRGEGFLLAIVVLQALPVLCVSLRRLAGMWKWLRLRFGPLQLAVCTSVFFLSAASPSWRLDEYLGELAFAASLQAVGLLNVLCVLQSWPRAKPDEAAVPSLSLSDSRWSPVAAAAVFVTLLGAMLALVVYEGWPHIPDEVAYYFQARTFASGHLWLPPPPVPEAFEIYTLFIHDGKWYSVFPPGWPAVLAVGVLVGAPWLINPLLGGLSVWLAYVAVKELFDVETAKWTALLLAASPWFVFMSMNLMSHALSLVLFLSGSLCTIKARDEERRIWPWLAGCSLGLLFLTRPLDGVVAGSFLAVMITFRKPRLRSWSKLAVYAVGCVTTGCLAFVYNWYVTGNPRVFPLDLYYRVVFGPDRYGMGFGPERGLGWPLDAFPGHSPFEGLLNSILNLSSLNVELHGWATGSLLLIVALVVSKRMVPAEKVLLAWSVTVVGAYFFYWYSGGPDFGPRYWYLIVVACTVLTVRGALLLSDGAAGGLRRSERSVRVTPIVLMMLSVPTLVNFFPWRALDKYHKYLYMSPDIVECVHRVSIQPGLVLVEGQQHPDFAAAFSGNPLDLSLPRPIYAWSSSRDVALELMEEYPDRPVWLVEGPSINSGGFRVVESPVGSFECDP